MKVKKDCVSVDDEAFCGNETLYYGLKDLMHGVLVMIMLS